MATIIFSPPLGKLVISFADPIPEAVVASGTISIQDGSQGFDLPIKKIEDRLVSIELQAAFAVLNLSQFQLPLWVSSSIDQPTGWRERLNIDPSLLKHFADGIQGGQWLKYPRPGKLAIFTHVFNEGRMLQLWERHYLQFVPASCLYVLDDGSADRSLESLSPEVNRISMPRGQLDHWNMASWSGYFQRFLLQRFQWVISTDCDELLIFKGNDPISVLENLSDSPCVLKPAMAVAPIHQMDVEPSFDFLNDRLFEKRAEIRLEDEMFLKPLIANTKVSWEPGFHLCYETTQTSEDVILVHAKYIDFEHFKSSTANWKLQQQTANDRDFFGRLEEINTTTIDEYCKAEVNKAMRRESAALPSWALGL
jgi:hypothetical protein